MFDDDDSFGHDASFIAKFAAASCLGMLFFYMCLIALITGAVLLVLHLTGVI